LSFIAPPDRRPVIDQTRLPGAVKVQLQFALPSFVAAAETEGSNGPSLLKAVQEQLCLKLKDAKGPVETLVIKHIERPTEN
jgi:uncharacterized protein (TIGR03435 family)